MLRFLLHGQRNGLWLVINPTGAGKLLHISTLPLPQPSVSTPMGTPYSRGDPWQADGWEEYPGNF